MNDAISIYVDENNTSRLVYARYQFLNLIFLKVNNVMGIMCENEYSSKGIPHV